MPTKELPKKLVTLFTRYDLSEDEELSGIQFTDSQRMYMQNLIATAAEEKIRLTFDPEHPYLFIQREAELQGTILTLESLLRQYPDYVANLTPTAAPSI